MRILHWIGSTGMTGVETFVLTLASAQRAKGDVPGIVCALEGRDELVAVAARRSVPVYPLASYLPRGACHPLRRKAINLARHLQRAAQLAAAVRSANADAVNLHVCGVADLRALLVARSLSVPSVVVTHHASPEVMGHWGSRMADAAFWLEKRCAHSVVPHRSAARELLDHGADPRRASVIPLCVDLARFKRRPKRAADGALRFVMLARMVEGKGHFELLAAAARLRHRHPQIRLLLVGDGPLRAAIARRAAECGVEEITEFAGNVSIDDVPEVLRSADVGVLPSYMQGETFPNALLEAGALGLPAIGTHWFGIPEIIQDGVTGFLIEPRDVGALAEVMERFARDPRLVDQMGHRAWERVSAHFSSEAVADQMLALYRRSAAA